VSTPNQYIMNTKNISQHKEKSKYILFTTVAHTMTLLQYTGGIELQLLLLEL